MRQQQFPGILLASSDLRIHEPELEVEAVSPGGCMMRTPGNQVLPELDGLLKYGRARGRIVRGGDRETLFIDRCQPMVLLGLLGIGEDDALTDLDRLAVM